MKLPPDLKIYGDINHRDAKCRKEWVEQKEFFGLLTQRKPRWAALALHPKNEGIRTGREAQFDAEQGALNAGASDIIIPARIPFVCELKRVDHTAKGCTLRKEQLAYLRAARDEGAFACIALGCAAAWEALLEWEKLTLK
jgi:hypothetical protein